jgi:hypothetical protein
LKQDSVGGSKKVGAIDRPLQSREVMMEDLNEFGGVSSCVPGGKGFCIDRGDLVHFFGVAVWDPVGCIADGTDKGGKESRKGCIGMVTESMATTFQWEVGICSKLQGRNSTASSAKAFIDDNVD